MVQNNPPARQFDDEPLNVLVEVHNDGATDIVDGQAFIFLSGFDSSLITGVSTFGERVEDLEGRDIDLPEGAFTVVNFVANVRDLRSRNIEQYEPNLLVTACYEYETIANPEICIDGDPYSISQSQKVCRGDASPKNLKGSQGGPVGVTRVKVEPSSGITRIEMTVENIGNGLAFKPGLNFLDRCNPYDIEGLDHNDINLVRLDELKIGTVDIRSSCKPLENGHIRIKSDKSSAVGGGLRGSGIVRCELRDINQPAFTSPLRIQLSYGYRNSVSRDVSIIQIP
tara:strand:- start:2394 stop:3242 length:849 start_codon:yes stop_codon:yes gene_type:complete